jgi:hypothetical protein
VTARAKEQVMVRGARMSRWIAIGMAAAWLAAGCAPKAEDTKVAASDSTVKAAETVPDNAAKDTTRAPTGDPAKLGTLPVKPKTPPPHIEVQHVLIAFEGTIPHKNITRSKEDAEKLAADVLDRARKGQDFDSLVQKYTDDQFPGTYDLANTGVTADKSKPEYPRGPGGMVSGFSDVAFRLSVGNVDVAPYQPDKDKPGYSPYGWHIIKRLK